MLEFRPDSILVFLMAPQAQGMGRQQKGQAIYLASKNGLSITPLSF